MDDKWFYAWLRAKEIREERSSLKISPSDENDRLFAYIARGSQNKTGGRFESFVKHIELSRHFAEIYVKKLMEYGSGEFQFMVGFCTALELLEYAAKKK